MLEKPSIIFVIAKYLLDKGPTNRKTAIDWSELRKTKGRLLMTSLSGQKNMTTLRVGQGKTGCKNS